MATTRNAANQNITVSAAGAINYPSQPCFLATYSASAADATGDGTVVTLKPDTITYNVGSGYSAASGIFTAPRTGKYSFICGVTSGLGYFITNNALLWKAIATSRTFTLAQLNPYQLALGLANESINASFYVDMTAGDTLYTTFVVTGGAKTVDILGSGFRTFMSGKLEV